MQFLFPKILWCLFALAIPVIVHLFNFRKTKKVFFSNVSFLKTVETQTSAFRKLKQLLILLSRILFLACLILAFAQPILPAANNLGKKINSLGVNSLYLDNSMSMQNTSENKRLIDLAVIKIDELLTLFRTSSNLQFFTNEFSGDDQFAVNSGKVKDKLTGLHFSNQSRNLENVYNRQRSLAQKNNPNGENSMFWFSDFQKSTSGNLKNIKVDSSDKVYLVPVQGKATQNVFVDSVWLGSPFIREMQNNTVFVKVNNSGDKIVEQLSLKLFIDGTQSSTSTVDISSKSSAVAKFNIIVKDKGYHKGKITFNDQPITFDNEYFFVLNASPTINVSHIHQQKNSVDYIAKMYQNDSLYNFKSFSINNIDQGQIKNADLLILEGISNLDPTLSSSLGNFMQNGGNLLIIPATNIDVNSYSSLLKNYGINNLRFTDGSNQAMVEINEPNKSSLFYADVFEKGLSNAKVNLPKSKPLLFWNGVGEKLLSFKNSQAFLSQTKTASGNLYIMSSPLNTSYSNFAEHAFFVPTFLKMATQSVKSQRIAYNFNEGTIELLKTNAPKNASYKLRNGKFEIIPVQRVLGNKLYLDLPKSSDLSDDQTLESGYFDLIINNNIENTLAINHDNLESELELYSPEELRGIFKEQKNVQVFDNIMDGDFVDTFRANSFGTPLWKYLIIAALIFLLIEICLVRFFKA